MNKNFSIENIVEALNTLQTHSGEKMAVITALEEAKADLEDGLKALEDIAVKGKDSLDILLGCILAIEMIIGKKGE